MNITNSLLHIVWIEEQMIGGIYDGHNNLFISINKDQHQELLDLLKYPDQNNSLLEKYLKWGIFNIDAIQNRISNSDEFVNGVCVYGSERACKRKLTIELTENCNLRCNYCRYTINEITKSGRCHNISRIDRSIAKKAIDQYLLNYSNLKKCIPVQYQSNFEEKNPPTISFYGGEVLLEKELLIELIEYSISLCDNLNLCPRNVITTNGTLLDNTTIDYLVNSNVYIAFSIDGPMSEHDKNRVYKDGTGSFNHVCKWFSYIRSKYPEYLSKMVSIQAVDAPNYDKKKVMNYFTGMSTKHHFAGVNNFMLLQYTDFSLNKPTFSLDRFNAFSNTLVDECILFFNSLDPKDDKENIIRKIRFKPNVKDILKFAFELEDKIFSSPQKLDNYFTSCYIGNANLVVSTNGDYHICERTDYSMPIGNVNTGIDNKIIKKIYKQYFTIMNRFECKNCWAAMFCPICVAQLINNGKVVEPHQDRCLQIRMMTDFYMKILVLIANNYSFLYSILTNYYTGVDNISIDEYLSQIKT